MGISQKTGYFLLKNKNLFVSKSILSLGNPFIPKSFDKKYLTHKQQILISKNPRKLRAHFFFMELLKAKNFKILDISKDEGADFIADLNNNLGKEFENKFDIVLDFGTQEHIFNTTQLYKNINYILKEKGYYIFDLPSNNCLEHGFRQYSPTNFYDLCSSNKSLFKICYLSLWNDDLTLNVLPLYKKFDVNFFKTVDSEKIINPIKDIDLGILTGFTISLLNKCKKETGILGVINKISNEDINFSIIQTLYKNLKLNEVLPEKTNNFSFKKHIINLIPMIISCLPPIFTIKLLNLFKKFKNLI